MSKKTYSGKYQVKNIQKYRGDHSNVVYRSSWELQVLRLLDNNPAVEWFSSEELVIPYMSPVDKRVHRYFVDVVYKSTTGMVTAVEIKPLAETKPPTIPKRKTKLYESKVKTYVVNQAKWEAADAYCKARGWQFKVWTELTLRSLNLLA